MAAHAHDELASVESPISFTIKFGLFPPVQVITCGDKVSVQPMKSKRGRKLAYAKAKKERCSPISEARELLKIDGKTDDAQLSAKTMLGALDQVKEDEHTFATRFWRRDEHTFQMHFETFEGSMPRPRGFERK
ncbi:hypothetical protein C2845_PM03G05060 [Panicum miliaceum]|uniref:Uncharacterized protein n=1 Tax=Panicum miliaceum TaxID=4540 RepID=A0A3L6TA60_PANMI|nr:hypothetical protein C2845_PM03G05060 [Panicum miliaceum]